MKRWYGVFAGLIVLSMLVSACTVVAPSAPGEAAPTKTRIVFYQRRLCRGRHRRRLGQHGEGDRDL